MVDYFRLPPKMLLRKKLPDFRREETLVPLGQSFQYTSMSSFFRLRVAAMLGFCAKSMTALLQFFL